MEYVNTKNVAQAYKVTVLSLPITGNKIKSQFKLFPEDIGILTSMYGIDIVSRINNGDLGQGKGAIYETISFNSKQKILLFLFFF